MLRKGFTIVAYLDDFFLCETTRSRCALAVDTLISLLRELGFMINWSKVVGTTQTLTYLGVEFDTMAMCLQPPQHKLQALREELAVLSNRMCASKKQLQSLVGKLNWAASIVFGGRVFIRRLINGITKLRYSSHKVRLIGEIRQDILWWIQFMPIFNGKCLLLDSRPISAVYTDACVHGGGGCLANDWFCTNWYVDYLTLAHLHINEKEILTAVLAVYRWAPHFRDSRIYIFSDEC